MVAIRNDLAAEEFPLKIGKERDIWFARISLVNAPPLYACAYYRPPSDNAEQLNSLEDAIKEIQSIIDKNPRASGARSYGLGVRT